MTNLTKRVDVLEKIISKGRKQSLWVEHAPDGGLVHDGQHYADADGLLNALGLKPDDAILISWRQGESRDERPGHAS